jgi:hypothetical protein
MDPCKILNSEGNEDFLELTKCRICLQVSLTPVTCKTCETVFCKECIENWKKKSNTCPMRCQNFEVKEESRLVKNILSKFYFQCEKCHNKIKVDEYEGHLRICSEDITACQNECGELIRYSFIDTHKRLFCPNALIQCHCCGSMVKRKELLYEKEATTDTVTYSKLKELENELKLKDEVISKLRIRKEVNHNDINIIGGHNNIDISNDYNTKLNYANLKEIKKLQLKNIIKSNSNNNLMIINNIHYFESTCDDNPHCNHLILSVTSGDLIYYDMTKNKVINTYKVHTDNFTDLKVVKNDNNTISVITTSFDCTISSVNLFTGEIKKGKLDCPATYVLISATNDIAIVGNVNGFIGMLLLDGFEKIISKKIHTARVVFMEYVNYKENIISFGKNNSLCLINLGGFAILKTINFDQVLTSCITNPYNNTLYLCTDKGDIFTYSNTDSNMIALQFNSKSSIACNTLYSYTIRNQPYLVVFSPLIGIRIYSVDPNDNNKINFVLEKKFDKITAIEIVNTNQKLIDPTDNNEHSSIIISNNNLNNNNISSNIIIDNKISNDLLSELTTLHYIILTRKDGSLNIFSLN